jgi:hypothetical protein
MTATGNPVVVGVDGSPDSYGLWSWARGRPTGADYRCDWCMA